MKKNTFLKSTLLKKKNILKKQILKNFLHTKNHVLIHFTPLNAQILGFACNFKKHDFEEKKFLESLILNKKLFLKSMFLNKKFL